MNYPATEDKWFPSDREYDHIFCNEVFQFLWNPSQALWNLGCMLKPQGTLYISFHRLHPDMKDHDYLRFTEAGVRKLLDINEFTIIDWQEPIEGYFLVTCKRSQL